MGWNGYDLTEEIAALLCDTTSTFKARVLSWLNDTQLDICTRHKSGWPFLRHLGVATLTASESSHSLIMSAPGAPSVTLASGGSLTDATSYSVLVTFYEGISGVESFAGTASSSVTAAAPNRSISVTSIPTSSNSLVTARRIYLKKGTGNYYLYSTIADNTTTTLSITADVTGTKEPPADDGLGYIRLLSGDPYIETSSKLEYRPIDQLRLLFQGAWGTGTPLFWSPLGLNRVTTYPAPSSNTTLNFYYFKNPSRLFADTDSIPSIPPYLKPVLVAGVIAYGYEFRDRDGQENKRRFYNDILSDAISRYGAAHTSITTVRDVIGNSEGMEVN